MGWFYHQNGRHDVDKMDTSYTQSNAWPAENENNITTVPQVCRKRRLNGGLERKLMLQF